MASATGKSRQAGVYTRISLDRTGAGLGVERQEQDCRRLATSKGYTEVQVYSDNDVSAYSGRHRPGYRQLLGDIGTGAVGVVIAWHTDRLHRSLSELEEYIAVCEQWSVDTLTVQAGELDLSTASGKLVARMLGAAARHESDQKSERVRRARQQAAERGEAHGPLGFGYNRDNTINAAQADIVREMARRILAGETLFSVAADLNVRAVPTPGGLIGAWRSVTIRQTIMRASLAGWREWKSGARGTAEQSKPGEFIARGSWSAILDRATVEDVRRLLTDPARRTSRRQPMSLLTGVLRCSKCAAPMTYSFDKRYQAGRYVCSSQPGLGRCGQTAIVAKPVDAMISEAVVALLESSTIPTVRQRDRGALSAAERELKDAREDRNELAAQRAAGEISSEEWVTMRRVLTDRISRAEQSIGVVGGSLSKLKGVPAGARARQWWITASMAQRRVVIRALIESVPIGPATKRTKAGVFDPERVEVPVWLV